MWAYNQTDYTNDYLMHHGIKGQKWGVRRFQNEDGSLTPLGRKRYGYDKYPDGAHDLDRLLDSSYNREDYTITKGTSANKVVDLDRKTNPTKGTYLSVDDYLSRGMNGKEFYFNWFADGGWSVDNVRIDDYVAKKDIKVANGKKVLETMLAEDGDIPAELLVPGQTTTTYKTGYVMKTASLPKDISIKEALDAADYKKQTAKHKRDLDKAIGAREIGERVLTKYLHDNFAENQKRLSDLSTKLSKQGYDAMEDIWDWDTSFPIVVFDTKKSFKKTSSTSGEDYYQQLVKKYKGN